MTDMAVSAQRDAAREKANAVRLHHARLCGWLRELPRDQAVAAAGVLITGPEGPDRSLPVEKLLRALPGVGQTKARLMMRHAGLVGPRRLGDLTAGQRELLVEALTLRPVQMRRTPPEAIVSRDRVGAAAAAIRAWRPDVADPRDVAELVLACDDERAAA